MKYGICCVSVAPVRSNHDDRSEMVTQLLFGEKVEIIAEHKNWIKIMAHFDSYMGWVDPKQFFEVSQNEYQIWDSNFYTSELFNLMIENNNPITLTLGANIHYSPENKIIIGDKTFEYLGETLNSSSNSMTVADIAKLYINTPYVWGGKSNFGIDCSGLVQQVYKLKNIKLPRDASQQAKIGEILSFVEETQMGDLAFFDNEEGDIIHVGIILDDQKIIHAHGKVRIDPLDSTGIFNTDLQQYSHKLRFLKRISEL